MDWCFLLDWDRTLPINGSSITKHTVYSCSDSFCNSSSKVSLSYWKRVPQLLDRNALTVSDKNSLHCWFLLNEKLFVPTCSLFRQSRSHMIGTIPSLHSISFRYLPEWASIQSLNLWVDMTIHRMLKRL